MDTFLFYTIFSLSKNPYIAEVSIFLSYVFIYFVFAILIVWSMFFAKKKHLDFLLFTSVGIISWLSAFTIKHIFQIARPYVSLPINPLFHDIGFSFPSEHASVFAGLAVASYFIHKKLGYVLGFFALVIGISRIVIGAHYPSDIVAGYLVGFLCARGIIMILKKKKYD